MLCLIVGPHHLVVSPNDPGGVARDIRVKGWRLYGVDSPDDASLAMTITWPASGGAVNMATAREFARALLVACKMGRGMLR